MTIKRFANSARTVLTVPITNGAGDTTLNVAATQPADANFPGQAEFYVRVDQELMLVTAFPANNTWTVVRGVDGTSPAAHPAGAAVIQVLNAAVMNVLTVLTADQAANTVMAGPATGGATLPGFRTLVSADFPAGVINALVPTQTGNAGKVLSTNGTVVSWASVGGTGTVTSVGMTVPSFLSVSGSPVTGAGTLAVTLATTTAKTVFAGPASGAAAAPTFRTLAATDLPGFNASGQGYPSGPTFLLALGAPATTGANKTNAVIAPRAGAITKAFAAAKTGPTGADLIFDINVNGSTIWSTQANRLKIAAGATSGTQTTFNTTTVAEGDLLTIDIDQVGSTVAGQDVTVYLLILLQNS